MLLRTYQCWSNCEIFLRIENVSDFYVLRFAPFMLHDTVCSFWTDIFYKFENHPNYCQKSISSYEILPFPRITITFLKSNYQKRYRQLRKEQLQHMMKMRNCFFLTIWVIFEFEKNISSRSLHYSLKLFNGFLFHFAFFFANLMSWETLCKHTMRAFPFFSRIFSSY